MKKRIFLNSGIITILFLSLFGHSYAAQEVSDLYIKKLVDAPREGVTRGSRVTYTVMYRNNGPNVSKNLIIQDHYDITSDLSDFMYPEYCLDTGKKIICKIPSLDVGIDYSFTYSAKVNYGANLGFLMSFINMYSDQKDYDERDNISRVRFKIIESGSQVANGRNIDANTITAQNFRVSKPRPDLKNKEPEKEIKSSLYEDTKILKSKEVFGPIDQNKNTEAQKEIPNAIDIIEQESILDLKPTLIEITPEKEEISEEIVQSISKIEIIMEPEFFHSPNPKTNTDSGPETWFLLVFSLMLAGYFRGRKKSED